MSITHRFAVFAAAAALACTSFTVLADDHPYSEGTVLNVSRIRTADGHFDDYLKWVSTKWKQEQEAAKKAGYIVGYEVLTANPREPDDADVILIIRYKNWAALDGWIMKGDALSKQTDGTVAAANQAAIDRSKIRRVLGESWYQTLDLK